MRIQFWACYVRNAYSASSGRYQVGEREIRKGSKAGDRKLGMNDITKRAQIKNGSRTEPWDTPIFRVQGNDKTPVKQTEKEQPIIRKPRACNIQKTK